MQELLGHRLRVAGRPGVEEPQDRADQLLVGLDRRRSRIQHRHAWSLDLAGGDHLAASCAFTVPNGLGSMKDPSGLADAGNALKAEMDLVPWGSGRIVGDESIEFGHELFDNRGEHDRRVGQ